LNHTSDARFLGDCRQQAITRTRGRLGAGDGERKQCDVGLKLIVFASAGGARLDVLAEFSGAVFRQFSEGEHCEVVSELVVIGHEKQFLVSGFSFLVSRLRHPKAFKSNSKFLMLFVLP
jgi:hypothetical protein